MASYHNYQQVLVLDGPGAGLKSTRIRRKFSKSVDGCLHCKQRRKKCDEQKPRCKNCLRRGTDCEWPQHVRDDPEEDPLLHQLISIQDEDVTHNENVSSEETRCYDAFVSVFLSSITPAHCHPLLSPMSILLPYAVTNSTVREIFLACGATLLAYNDDSLVDMAYSRYHTALNMLVRDIQRSRDACEDHLFISVQLLQTLCLRDKSLGLNATKSAAHLTAAYEILKKRFSRATVISPLDRILTEHFIFNYPITLILCHHDKLDFVPSPFDFFDQFGRYLEIPLNDSSDDPWLNHPILGVGLKAHELASKLSWMCRLKELPLGEEDSKLCQTLKQEVTDNLERLDAMSTVNLEKPQKQTLSFSKSVLYGAMILAKKLCDHTIQIQDMQKELKLLMNEINFSRTLDGGYFQPIWAMFIGGSVAITKEDRSSFSEGFKNVSKILHSSLAQKVLRYLEIIWNDEANDPVGLDFLFDTTVLDIVCT